MKFSGLKFFLIIYFLLLVLYSIFSYSLTAPNLVLTSWQPYWQFQTWMWEVFFNDRQLLAYTFTALMLGLFFVYTLILRSLKKEARSTKHEERNKFQNFRFKIFKYCFEFRYSSFEIKALLVYFLITVPLLFSNNALSYDVFNYMFNAKVVMQYGGNPHTSVPLNYSQDEWLRFMHNTHTVAPYGYGWTALSLIPYSLGLGKFLPTWVIFRLFSYLSIFLLYFSLKFLAKNLNLKLTTWNLGLLFLNPLFLIEIISNSHNDLFMLVPAVVSLALVINPKTESLKPKQIFKKKQEIIKLRLSALLLAFSVSIKLATVVLIPIWLILVLSLFKFKISSLFRVSDLGFRIFENNFILFSSIFLFLPLITERSKQFLPWYLLWSLVWIPLLAAKKRHSGRDPESGVKARKLWVSLLLIFSLTSMLRYIPYLWFGDYAGQVDLYQKLITWSAIPVWIAYVTIKAYVAKNRTIIG